MKKDFNNLLKLTLSLLIVVTTFSLGTKKVEAAEGNYLKFTALETSSVTFDWVSGSDVQYKVNNNSWSSYTKNTKISLNKGESVSFKGLNVKTGYGNGANRKFTMTGKLNASGSVTSLTDGRGDDPNVVLSDACYENMFGFCESLVTSPELPATTLARNCYHLMFNGCKNLTTVPELPATKMANSCYMEMFKNCSSLTSVPELPATVLDYQCYDGMFWGCSSIKTAPELPATELASFCYSSMFTLCKALENAPELRATELKNHCYSGMFSNCTSLTDAPELPATVMEQGCYQNMFYNCSNINEVRLTGNFGDISDIFLPCNEWLTGTGSGKLYVVESLLEDLNETQYDALVEQLAIPESWDLETIKHEHVFGQIAEDGIHSICGECGKMYHGEDWVDFNNYSNKFVGVKSGKYYLSDDLIVPNNRNIYVNGAETENVVICANGHNIVGNSVSYLIISTNNKGVNFILDNCDLTNKSIIKNENSNTNTYGTHVIDISYNTNLTIRNLEISMNCISNMNNSNYTDSALKFNGGGNLTIENSLIKNDKAGVSMIFSGEIKNPAEIYNIKNSKFEGSISSESDYDKTTNGVVLNIVDSEFESERACIDIGKSFRTININNSIFNKTKEFDSENYRDLFAVKLQQSNKSSLNITNSTFTYSGLSAIFVECNDSNANRTIEFDGTNRFINNGTDADKKNIAICANTNYENSEANFVFGSEYNGDQILAIVNPLNNFKNYKYCKTNSLADSNKIKLVNLEPGFVSYTNDNSVMIKKLEITKQPTLDDRIVNYTDEDNATVVWQKVKIVEDVLDDSKASNSFYDYYVSSYDNGYWTPDRVNTLGELGAFYFILENCSEGDRLDFEFADEYKHYLTGNNSLVLIIATNMNDEDSSYLFGYSEGETINQPLHAGTNVITGYILDYDAEEIIYPSIKVSNKSVEYDSDIESDINDIKTGGNYRAEVTWYEGTENEYKQLSNYFTIVDYPTLALKEHGILELNYNGAALIDTFKVGYAGEEEPTLEQTLESFTAAVKETVSSTSSPKDGYKLSLTKSGWYVSRIKYKSDETAKSWSYKYEKTYIDLAEDDINYKLPIITKENGHAVLRLNGTSVQTMYYGFVGDNHLIDNGGTIAKDLTAYQLACKEFGGLKSKTIGDTQETKFRLTQLGTYIFRVKYLDKTGNYKYLYKELEVGLDDLYIDDVIYSVKDNTITIKTEEFNINSIELYLDTDTNKTDNLINNSNYVLYASDIDGNAKSAVLTLTPGKYRIFVKDIVKDFNGNSVLVNGDIVSRYCHNQNGQLANLSVGADTTINIAGLADAIKSAKAFNNTITADDSAVLIKSAVSGTSAPTSAKEAYEKVIKSADDLMARPDKWTQSKVNTMINNLTNAKKTFVTKIVGNYVSVNNDVISILINNLPTTETYQYAYVAKGVHTNLTTMNTSGTNKNIGKNTTTAVLSGDGIYTVRLKSIENNSAVYRYLYVLVDTDGVDCSLTLSKEMVGTKGNKNSRSGLWAEADSLLDNLDGIRNSDLTISAAYEDNKFVVSLDSAMNEMLAATTDYDMVLKAVALREKMADTPKLSSSGGTKIEKTLSMTGLSDTYDFTESTTAKDSVAIVVNENNPATPVTSVEVSIDTTNAMYYKVAYGDLKTLAEFTTDYQHFAENGKYTVKHDGTYTIRVKWYDGSYTYQTFTVSGLPEPIKFIATQDGKFNITLDESLGVVSKIESKYLGPNANLSVAYFTEFNSNSEIKENPVIIAYGNGLHEFKVDVTPTGGDITTVIYKATASGADNPVIKYNESVIGVFDYSNNAQTSASYTAVSDGNKKYLIPTNNTINAGTFAQNGEINVGNLVFIKNGTTISLKK